jgi:hypothetical protein
MLSKLRGFVPLKDQIRLIGEVTHEKIGVSDRNIGVTKPSGRGFCRPGVGLFLRRLWETKLRAAQRSWVGYSRPRSPWLPSSWPTWHRSTWSRWSWHRLLLHGFLSSRLRCSSCCLQTNKKVQESKSEEEIVFTQISLTKSFYFRLGWHFLRQPYSSSM